MLHEPVPPLGCGAHPEDELRERFVESEPPRDLCVAHRPAIEFQVVHLSVDPDFRIGADIVIGRLGAAEDRLRVESQAQRRQLDLVFQVVQFRLPAAVDVLRTTGLPADGPDDADAPPRHEPAEPTQGLALVGEQADCHEHRGRHGV